MQRENIERLKRIVQRELAVPGDTSWHRNLPEMPELPSGEDVTQAVVIRKKPASTPAR